MFRRYQSKPVTRLAYQIKPADTIEHEMGESACTVTPQNDPTQTITFVAHQEVKAGDYIVYLDDKDVYHCSEKVFTERNFVESNGIKPEQMIQ